MSAAGTIERNTPPFILGAIVTITFRRRVKARTAWSALLLSPGHIIVVQKCEQPVPVLLDPFLQRQPDISRAW